MYGRCFNHTWWSIKIRFHLLSLNQVVYLLETHRNISPNPRGWRRTGPQEGLNTGTMQPQAPRLLPPNFHLLPSVVSCLSFCLHILFIYSALCWWDSSDGNLMGSLRTVFTYWQKSLLSEVFVSPVQIPRRKKITDLPPPLDCHPQSKQTGTTSTGGPRMEGGWVKFSVKMAVAWHGPHKKRATEKR